MPARQNLLKELNTSVYRFEQRKEKLIKLSNRFAMYRLFLLIISIAAITTLFFTVSETAAWITLAAAAVVFGLVTSRHNKVDNGIRRTGLWIEIKKTNIARLNIEWDNLPAPKSFTSSPQHPFEGDLNISGSRSLMHLIDNSVTREGGERLYGWLTAVDINLPEILRRQKLVNELKSLPRFRDKLILSSRLINRKEIESQKIIEWLRGSSETGSLKKILPVIFTVHAAALVMFILYLAGIMPPYFSMAALVYLGIYWFNNKHVKDLFDDALEVEGELGKFYSVLNFLEIYKYKKDSLLSGLCASFSQHGSSPSRHFKRISRTITFVSFQKNPLSALLLNAVFPYDFYFAYKLKTHKAEIADKLEIWVDVWHELEALSSLASFAYLNPEAVFPVIDDKKEDNVFEIINAGHPLIPASEKVRNSFTFRNTGEAVIITGSNMSGKSTFLRTVGLNLVMAYAGGAVDAAFMSTRLLRLYTCIKISDSVTDGISYFYAEVKRLKQLLTALHAPGYPLLYLIDEIFRGTNNIERLTGSRSYIKALAAENGLGFISTHDLELVKLEQELPSISNYHFREEAYESRMIFDYKLREGPCPTTNALKIMKMEGLPVEYT